MELFILILCLSFDVLLASFSYGVNKIKIPFKSTLSINSTVTISFIIALLLGSVVSSFLDQTLIRVISFFILFALSLIKFFEYTIKRYFSKINNKEFKMYDIKFILQVVQDNTLADTDKSKVLSVSESISLGLALSLDGMCAALSFGMEFNNYLLVFLFSFSITYIMLFLGNYIGKKIGEYKEFNLSWLSGVILFILAITKLI